MATLLEEEAIMTSASWGGGATSCCSSGSHILTLPQGSSPHLRGAEERDPGEGNLEGNLEQGKTSPISGAPAGGVYFSALISSFKRGLAGNSGGLLCGISPLFLHTKIRGQKLPCNHMTGSIILWFICLEDLLSGRAQFLVLSLKGLLR